MDETPTASDRLGKWLAPLVFLSNNWISRIGIFLVTTAGVSWLFLLPTLLKNTPNDPYIGLLTVFALPAVFFAGLALIPLGIWLKRRAHRKDKTLPETYARLSLSNQQVRQFLMFLLIATGANVIIAGQLTMRAVDYMEGKTFCGQTCHTPMNPEYVSAAYASHAELECTKCHIEPGTRGYIKAKVRGASQLLAVITNSYSRPIHPALNVVPTAKQSCETCHNREFNRGDQIKHIEHFGDDEKNTPKYTVLVMHLGGGGSGKGIHGAHLAGDVKISYKYSDERTEDIQEITYEKGGQTTVWSAGKAATSELRTRTMDCIDCHSRPAHTFEQRDRALDRALAHKEIDPTLPFAKKHGVEVLNTAFASEEEAATKIPVMFASYYKDQGQTSAVEQSGAALAKIYARNVFPSMKVTWGTYPNELGHTDSPGCFRCHDEKFTNPAGKTMSQDCSLCHNLAVMDEESPKVLSDLGMIAEAPAKDEKDAKAAKK